MLTAVSLHPDCINKNKIKMEIKTDNSIDRDVIHQLMYIPSNMVNSRGRVLGNFPITLINPHNEKLVTCWISRSMASTFFGFAKEEYNHWWDPSTWFKKPRYFVLAEKRGPGCPDEIGKYACPGGYLDRDENLYGNVTRETKEETGVNVNFKAYIDRVDSNPKSNMENVTTIFFSIMPMLKQEYECQFSKLLNEKNEVDEICFIPYDEVDNYEWAFGHDRIIRELYEKYIACPFWKKVIIRLYNKYCNMNFTKDVCSKN